MQFLIKNLSLDSMEDGRDAKTGQLDLSGASIETIFTDDSLQELSISGELEKMETSRNGAFDSDKVPSAFQFCMNDSDGLTNARARSMKRFERGLGVTLVRSDDIELQPVNIIAPRAQCVTDSHNKDY